MPRVVGIDLGTSTTDVCGLEDGRVFLAKSLATSAALASPSPLFSILESATPLDLIVGPSGYGLPLVAAREMSPDDVALAALGVSGESGGIAGFRTLLRALAASDLPVMITPAVIHLPSVPAHRKVNRVDMGTADKVCACALGIHQRARDVGCLEADVSFLLLETGGAFSAALAVQNGAIVDGFGGTSGPIGMASAGSWDGEVAFLAEHVTKAMLFRGGARSIAGAEEESNEAVTSPSTERGRRAWTAYVEGAVKAIAALATSAPGVRDLVLSGRFANDANLRDELMRRLAPVMGKPIIATLNGFMTSVKQGAQGAALIADGLVGGHAADLVRGMGLRDASGTALDHLYVISKDAARRRLGLS